jgi:hypothetical protein
MNAAVIYWKHIKHLTNLEFEGIIPEIGIIETEYALVWKGAMEDDTQPEDLFRIFNDADSDIPNPLRTNSGQDKIISLGVKHTSMSVADIVRLDKDFWICMPQGWRKLSN